jgi:signal transduction histidine kinase
MDDVPAAAHGGATTPQALRAMFECWPEPCLLVDVGSGRIVEVNAALTQGLGHSAAALRGQPLDRLAWSEVDAPRGTRAAWPWPALAAGDDLFESEIAVRGHGGQPRRMLATAMSLPAPGPLRPQGARLGLVLLRAVPGPGASEPAGETASRADVQHGSAGWRPTTRPVALRRARAGGPIPSRRAAAVAPAASEDTNAPDEAEHWRRRAFEAVLAQGRERERIAAGLHDDIGQTLAVAALKLGELQRLVAAPAGSAAQATLAELRQLLGEATRATRSATFDLSCPLLAQLGLVDALDGVLRRAGEGHALQVALRGDAPDPPLAEPALSVVFRVARELVFNVCKHAGAHRLELRLRSCLRGLALTVADDGRGFLTADARLRFGPEGGYGLASASAQVQALGGRLVLRSRPGRGTVARLWLPAGAPREIPWSPR